MKKILFLIATFLFSINICYAKNKIYDIDIKVYIDKVGTANITESWHVDGSDGTEWYKVMNNLGNMSLTDFKVSMDGNPLTYKTWDVDESLSQKKGYYGINYTNNGKELCFGKYDYKEHTFTLTYKLSNFIFNVEDAQVIYFNFIDRLSNVDFQNYSIEIESYYKFPDTLDVWGYGYKGYAYVENGVIKASNEDKMNNKYVVLLVKFPLGTFNTNNSTSLYNDFDSVLTAAKNGSYAYDYDNDDISFFPYGLIAFLPQVIIWFLIIVGVASASKAHKYGYIDNKKINKENSPYYRDIPCNKNIYYANALLKVNNQFGAYKANSETNILGAIFLSWIKNGIMSVNPDNKESLIINPINGRISNELESELYGMVYKASKDGILEKKELEKWARSNYSKFFSLFRKISDNEVINLKASGKIFTRTSKEQCKYKNVLNDEIYEDSKKLYGMKLFLDEFSNIKEREAIEVNLWDEYLMFAYLFGNADKVIKQFKNLYPEIVTQIESSNIDFGTLIFLNHISHSSVSAASSARSAAQSYSSGGGGFSSGGGGGGSFGGGGGGSR